MLKALIGLLCLVSCYRSAQADATSVYKAQEDIIDYMRQGFPGVQVTTVWKPCGYANTFYEPRLRQITLCTEMEQHPEAATFFAAHEMAHAITHQLLSNMDEEDADEIAAIAMIEAGLGTEVANAGLYWRKKLYQGHISGDDHPSAGYRAWFLVCVASGLDEPGYCRDLLMSTVWKWTMRLVEYR